MDAVLLRVYQKALANQLAIAIGSTLSDPQYAIPMFAEAIVREFSIDFPVEHPLDYFRLWNEFIDTAEKVGTRKKLGEFAVAYFHDPKPTPAHQLLAAVPISNFIDATFDRSLIKALSDAGRTPRVHQWMGERMGGWKLTNADKPTVFCMLPEPDANPTFFGLHEPVRKHKIHIHMANVGDMLSGRDLLLFEFSPEEADWILNLNSLAMAGDKFVHYTQRFAADSYWSARGVLVRNEPIAPVLDRLLPHEEGSYGDCDVLSPRRKLIDITRKKQYDCFISYYSGDADFVSRLERDLTLRELSFGVINAKSTPAIRSPARSKRVSVSLIAWWLSSQPTRCNDRGCWKSSALPTPCVSRANSRSFQSCTRSAPSRRFSAIIGTLTSATRSATTSRSLCSNAPSRTLSCGHARRNSPLPIIISRMFQKKSSTPHSPV